MFMSFTMTFKKWTYPSATLSNPSIQRFADESGPRKTGQGTDRQFDWFVPDKGNGLTRAGFSRLNQSIEAFLYCILGADGGRAKDAQSQILTLLEDAIRQPAGQTRAAVPAGCRQGKSETLFGSDAWSVADALSHCN